MSNIRRDPSSMISTFALGVFAGVVLTAAIVSWPGTSGKTSIDNCVDVAAKAAKDYFNENCPCAQLEKKEENERP